MVSMGQSCGYISALSRHAEFVPVAQFAKRTKIRTMTESIIERIERRLAEMSMKAEAASKAAGLSRDAIRGIRRGMEDGRQRGVSTHTLERLAPILKVSPEWLAFGVETTRSAGLVAAPMQTRLQAGVWSDHPQSAVDGRDPVYVPSHIVPRGATIYAAEVVGNSMNRVYPAGTCVILEKRFDDPATLIPGRRYHVERQRADGSVEGTLKLVRRRADGSIWLVPESDDPEFQASIPLTGSPGEHISFVGRVLCAIVPG